MKNIDNYFLAAIVVAVLLMLLERRRTAYASTSERLDRSSARALQMLYRANPLAKSLSEEAKAILIFPDIVKAGTVFGGSYGEGQLVLGKTVQGYYHSLGRSWGAQGGAQSSGYAIFLMTDNAVKHIGHQKGWEIGIGPTVVLLDEGNTNKLPVSELKEDAYAFVFSHHGLMAGINLEGTKISHINNGGG